MTLRKYFFPAVMCLVLGSCAQRLICPAYQRTFIHDKETLRKKFSYFENDTTPKVYTASKGKYLVAVPESYRKRYRKMQTVNMQEVHPDVPDSILNPNELLAEMPDSVASAPLDSLGQIKRDSLASVNAADSVYVITKDREIRILKYNFPDSLHYDSATGRFVKEIPGYFVDEVGYNNEQENYMWFFRKELILPDVRLSKSGAGSDGKSAKAKGATAKEKKSFFQKLMFWKKDKKKDSLNIAPVSGVSATDSLDFDQSDTTRQAVPSTPAKTKKKGLGLFKKKSSSSTTEPPKQPAKKEEEGF